MPKFDYVIQNPPYNKSLHLDFFNKGLDMLSNDGKMVIIEPSTWLIDLRKDARNAIMYDKIKNRIKDFVYRIVIENYNNEFNVGLSMPFSITYIDKHNEHKNIEFINCGYRKYVNSIYNCNFVGDSNVIDSIFKKVKALYKDNLLEHHIYNKKSKINKNTKFAAIAQVMRGGCGDPRFSDEWFVNNLYRCYFYHCFNDKESISDTPHKKLCTGYTYENPKYKDELALNIYGENDELNNFKNFVFNNSLSKFINICIIQDMNTSTIHKYIPWIADKHYTDEEIYTLFDFTDEEIKLIETTIKKYERHSPWFKRYMCGPSSIMDEEVQKFIEGLDNA